MIFDELPYFLFFLLPSVLAFHKSPRAARPVVLAVFGAVFFLYYGYVYFGGIYGALCILIFLTELLFSRFYSFRSRWCVFGVVQAISFLAIFKYLGFAEKSINDVGAMFQLPAVFFSTFLFLPLGISFFTFEFIHVAADVYTGRASRPHLAEYAAFILFFPTMVAGPIKRIQDFLPELRAAKFDRTLASRGVTRILAGLVKKHMFADSFALWSNQLNTGAIADASPWIIALWVLAYAWRIYFDFSGYSDIAIGSAYLFGIHVPENFNLPYISRNIAEFWRRWHISLGRWIFDYIYVPLGGSRKGEPRVVVSYLVAFAVSGLWHGAAYNFVLWGLWHGVMMCVNRIWGGISRHADISMHPGISTVVTFAGVTVGWMLFCMDTSHLGVLLERMVAK